MGLQWWEYYEINHKVKNLRNEIAELEDQIKSLRKELEEVKSRVKNKGE